MKALNTKPSADATTKNPTPSFAMINKQHEAQNSSSRHHKKQLQKSFTEDSQTSYKKPSANSLHLNFRKSHTCGSLFAKCSCELTPPSPTLGSVIRTATSFQNDTLTDKNSTKCQETLNAISSHTPKFPRRAISSSSRSKSLSSPSHQSNPSSVISGGNSQQVIEAVPKKERKLFQSYSHPDTSYIFTDENKNPSKNQIYRSSTDQTYTTRDGLVEIHPKRLSSPNIGNYTILDVAVHPEFQLKVATKNVDYKTTIKNAIPTLIDMKSSSIDLEDTINDNVSRSSEINISSGHIDIINHIGENNRQDTIRRRSLHDEFTRSADEFKIENQPIEVLNDNYSVGNSIASSSDQFVRKEDHRAEIASSSGGSSFDSDYSEANSDSAAGTDSDRETLVQIQADRNEGKHNPDNNFNDNFFINFDNINSSNPENSVQSAENLEYLKYNALSYQQLGSISPLPTKRNVLDSAAKFYQDSGIFGGGPIAASASQLIRKTSKIMHDPHFKEQIRKNSKLYRQHTEFRKMSGGKGDELEYARSVVPNLKLDGETGNGNNGYGAATMASSALDRDIRVKTLEDEILELKDTIKNRDSDIYKLKREIHKLKSVLQQTARGPPLTDGDLLSSLHSRHGMASLSSSPTANGEINNSTIMLQVPSAPGDLSHRIISVPDSGQHETDTPTQKVVTDETEPELRGSHTCSGPVVKKQGVSGESSDAASQQLTRDPIPKYDKDFRSKQLIKDAIMDNDFLKHIDSSQIRHLVDSMYSLDVSKGEYVIREGAVGAHLYVSAEGEYEVIKADKTLGTMGPGKAFGELAILYNCTRTASIRAITYARVWVLDRRVFQQIMMRTGMQRIEEYVNFLKSVPLLKNLSNDVLTKIADVLEVEFYPAGAFIIRQGATGDTFYLISQGTVKVTQRLNNSSEEKEIRTLERGDYFGEQALINEDKRTANIIALAPGVECLTLDRESFSHLIGDLCELKEKDYGDENRVLAMRYAEKNSEIFGSDIQQEMPELQLSDLEVAATLGVGGFGRVELVKCYHENRVQTFALKCLKKQHIVDTRQEEHVFSERTIMLTCKTPFICRLYRTFRDSKYVYMLLEACMGGEVWTILRDRGCFDDNTTQFIIGCVLQAFDYLHSRGIIYRDLKPENLMLDERGYVKLVDFGFAKFIGQSSKTWTFCGTPEYVAPEIILNKGHDRAVDYWALGILIHELLNGTPPFTANDPMKTYNIILKGIDMIDFPKYMSRSAIMLIKRLCRDVPAERLGYQKAGIQDIKKHKWFQGFDWDGLSSLMLIPPFIRPVSHSLDTCYFDKFPKDDDIPPDELSGWDADF